MRASSCRSKHECTSSLQPLASRRISRDNPGTLQQLLEVTVGGLKSLLRDVIGHEGDKFLYIDQQGYIKQCPELPPVAHLSNLDEYRAQPVSCGLCWYACRGEHQTKISPRRVAEWL